MGSLWGGIGVLLLLYGALFLNEKQLQSWGLLIFAVALAFIAFGLIPYRKMNRFETHPHEILITHEGFTVHLRGEKPYTLLWNDVKGLKFVARSVEDYGIDVELKDSEKKIFLPYFSERSLRELEEFRW